MVLVVNTAILRALSVVRHMKREVIAAKLRRNMIVIRNSIGHRTLYAGVKMTPIGKVSLFSKI